MPRHACTHSTAGAFGTLTVEQIERVRAALRSAAGADTGDLELGIEELEERIAPGLNATN